MPADLDFDEVEAAFRVLSLEPGAPAEDVKAAYKFGLQAYHPDKYPEGSSSQKMAAEKLIAVKDANELILKFFLLCPTGAPPNGWKTKSNSNGAFPGGGGATGPAGQGSSAGDGESVDWTAWGKQQEGNFQSELGEWEKREAARQTNVKEGFGREQRRKLVTYGKIALVIIVLCLWSGKFSNNVYENANRRMQAEAWKEKAMYRAQTLNAATGYRITQQQALDQAKDEANDMKSQWMEEDGQRTIGLVFLFALSAGVVWLFRAKKAKAFLDAWVDGQAPELSKSGTSSSAEAAK